MAAGNHGWWFTLGGLECTNGARAEPVLDLCTLEQQFAARPRVRNLAA